MAIGTGADELPVPMGVRVDTGKACPPLTADEAAIIAAPSDKRQAVRAAQAARVGAVQTFGTDSNVDDPEMLNQAGWAVLFASDADPEIKKQLQPLLDLRAKQVATGGFPGGPQLYKEFAGTIGSGKVPPDLGGVGLNADGTPQEAADWAADHGVALDYPVVVKKVPYYLLIVGSPERIPFKFQMEFKQQWVVGRLYFDDIEDYGRYAASVVAYETAPYTPIVKNAAGWITSNPGDVPTMVLSQAICGDFQATDGNADYPLGTRQGWSFDLSSNGAATKARLGEILQGKCAHGRPAIVFTGSHGAEFTPPIAAADADAQKKTQGALITQEYVPASPAKDGAVYMFTAEDIPEQNALPGTMIFMFACFSVGCPQFDSYYTNGAGTPLEIAPAPLVSKLAQAMLAKGALAVIGHVDRAFKYGFADPNGATQAQAFRTPIENLMKGQRVGMAADCFSSICSSIAAGLQKSPPAGQNALVRVNIACDDARNYVVLGDPAVKLRVKADS
jgi:hypothetical protein